MNYLAIDWGQKKVGLARGNSSAGLASPLPTLANDADFMKNLQAIIREHQIDELVVGLPRNLAGEQTAQTQEIKNFAAGLSRQLRLRVRWQDETLTSQLSSSRPLSKQFDSHAEAATMILQDYLDESSKP